MSNRLDYYFRQRVTEAELDLGFTDLEQADQNLALDLGFTGVIAGAVVSQHASPNLTIDVSGPGAILDQLGQRIFFSTPQNVNVALDSSGAATAVSIAGHQKIVSVFVMFDRALSDPRVDGNSLNVFFRRDESFKFVVVQGAETSGIASPPPLRSDAILLADITRRFAQTQVLGADISIARRQDAFVLDGIPESIRRGRTSEVVSDLLAFYNDHVSGVIDRHAGIDIDYSGGPNWADTTTNPPASVEDQLNKIIGDLATTGGAPKIGAAPTAGAPNSLAAGSVKSQLDALLGFLNGLAATGGADKVGVAVAGQWADGTGIAANHVRTAFDEVLTDLAGAAANADGIQKIGAAAIAGSPNNLAQGTARSQLAALLGALNAHVNQATGAHAASAISYAAGPNWKDGTTNPATSVQAQLDGLVNALTADAGATRIGVGARTSWLGGRANPTGVSIFAAFDKIITDLAATTAADDGAKRIGTQSSGGLPAGSVRSQLDSLDATAARTNVANVFTAAQTLNGATGDTNATLLTTSAPSTSSTRKLLWQIAGGVYSYRLYSANQTLEITVNARWDGTQWVKDAAFNSLRFELNNFELRSRMNPGTTTPFAETAWTNQVALATGGGVQSFDSGGNWTSPGLTETFAGWQGSMPSTLGTVGTGVSFRKVFSTAPVPSSITYNVINSANTSGTPFTNITTTCGCSVSMSTTITGGNTFFFTKVFAQ